MLEILNCDCFFVFLTAVLPDANKHLPLSYSTLEVNHETKALCCAEQLQDHQHLNSTVVTGQQLTNERSRSALQLP